MKILFRLNKFQSVPTGIMILALISSIKSSKPLGKRKQNVWRLECELGVITDADCPVDGGWASWSAWDACRGPCDNVGHRRRTRQCINPPPSNDGIPCNGNDEEIESCYLTNCTVKDFRNLIDGDAARIEAFHQLEAVPAMMDRCLQMECPFEAIEAALASDNTWQLDPEALWNALQCVKHNLGCPVSGGWGAWGSWSACGARCGQGLRWRLRRCDTPAPSNALLFCAGTPLQAETCEGNQCAVVTRDTDEYGGSWGEWGPWTACSENCGAGVRRRRRNCQERMVARSVKSWGTHCLGQHDQFKVCQNSKCVLDGGWAGWGAWGPCSQTCGSGKKSRTRSCTRPIAAGGGQHCIGPRTEIGSCYVNPCVVFSHEIALFNGDSHLQYDFEFKRSTLFHFYARFLPLSPHGTLVRRGVAQSPTVRLSFQNWHLCLDASGNSQSCTLTRICSPNGVEATVWHSVLITVTSVSAVLRLNDAPVPIQGTFPCDPELSDDTMSITVGEKLHGEIQEVDLNFVPLEMKMESNNRYIKSYLFPSAASNIAYEKANKEEAYLQLDSDQYLRIPCFVDQDEWQLELTFKSKTDSGTILLFHDESSHSWLYMGLQNMRLKLKLAVKDFRSESSCSTDFPPGQWLDISLSKKRQSGTIEATINQRERCHVVLEEDESRKTRGLRKSKHVSEETSLYTIPLLKDTCQEVDQTSAKPIPLEICNDEFFVGGVPNKIKNSIGDDFTPFFGVIASISINNFLQDLHAFGVERYKDGKIQVSSKTASVSGSYHEIAWGTSERLNLTCLHARTARSPHTANWLFLDTSIKGGFKDKSVRSVDDGRVLRLMATANNDLRGFYTCRAHINKRTRNIVTYGVVGKVKYNLSGPDTTTAFAVLTTVTLVVGTLTWLIIEGINDLHTGYGFFRDAHLSPEEEAEAVCKYIDDNMDLVGSESAARLAKDRARKKARHLASRSSFAAQEPQGLLQIENDDSESIKSHQEPELPTLPEIRSNIAPESTPTSSHNVFRCMPSYVSSPCHGTNIISPRTMMTSSSSEHHSPRHICSRLLLARRIYSPRDLTPRRNKSGSGRDFVSPRKHISNLLTIKSSTYMNPSPAQKILQKFHELKSDDL